MVGEAQVSIRSFTRHTVDRKQPHGRALRRLWKALPRFMGTSPQPLEEGAGGGQGGVEAKSTGFEVRPAWSFSLLTFLGLPFPH